eukprot:1907998-Pyramimonas_sp.AAC.1
MTGWYLMSRAWSRFASLAARQIGGAAGSSTTNYGAFGKPLQARWVAIEYTMKDPVDVKVVADGWRWLTHAIHHIAQMQRAAATVNRMILRVAEEVAAMSTS